MKLYRITDPSDPLTSFIKDDPVRPHIPLEQRVNASSEILMLKEAEEILAVTCMSWLKEVPTNEQDLVDLEKTKDVAVFYTIWSYSPGAGAKLLHEASTWLKQEYKDIKGIVTLSPKTNMARRFHLKNGARIRSENTNSVNYEYYFKE